MFFVVILLLGATAAEIFDLTTPKYSTWFWAYTQGLNSYIPAGHPSLDRIDPNAT